MGIHLEKLTWLEAEAHFAENPICVIPLGAATKEHGPHLPLNNDYLIAEHFKEKVLAINGIIVMPTINYHYFPAFTEYPGSVTLSMETATNLVVDICRSIHRHGPNRFYILNTGISTLKPLAAAADILKKDGVTLKFSNISHALEQLERETNKQEGGSHADETETSLMLAIAPQVVDMKKAVKDYSTDRGGRLTRDPDLQGTYSPTGTWGDPTLATKEKGLLFEEAFTKYLFLELSEFAK